MATNTDHVAVLFYYAGFRSGHLKANKNTLLITLREINAIPEKENLKFPFKYHINYKIRVLSRNVVFINVV